MPITAFGWLAKNFSICARFRRRRTTTSPATLRPCTSKTFFAVSIPIMLAFSMDGPLSLVAVSQNQCGTLMPGGGRPHHHPDRSEAEWRDLLFAGDMTG